MTGMELTWTLYANNQVEGAIRFDLKGNLSKRTVTEMFWSAKFSIFGEERIYIDGDNSPMSHAPIRLGDRHSLSTAIHARVLRLEGSFSPEEISRYMPQTLAYLRTSAPPFIARENANEIKEQWAQAGMEERYDSLLKQRNKRLRISRLEEADTEAFDPKNLLVPFLGWGRKPPGDDPS
ncbi:MAG: hypothetical protein AB7H77_09245 [Bdellovibrionales bacterium]